ncbi:DoxX family protein [Occultella glacieicola]|uniref:DoxX family protein n=1 Tax=Occultella glacieicola TaxID=2518684 RepID=A0ABY2EDC5_9MICO|nr:DoxX family protein [Occultella glacieicola]TDE98797.1 DoxX family protein [Occultella glacieicola]
MTIAFWVVAALLALAFLGAGTMKLIRSKQSLAGAGMAWTEDFSARAVKAIGAVEVVGAVGVLVPVLTGVAPILSPIAAVGLALTMVGAIVVHARRKESATPAVVLLVLGVAAAALGFLFVA